MLLHGPCRMGDRCGRYCSTSSQIVMSRPWRGERSPAPPNHSLTVARVSVLLRWIREGVNNLLPVAQIGGEVVAARLLRRRGQRTSSRAIAGSVGDLTMEMLDPGSAFTLGGPRPARGCWSAAPGSSGYVLGGAGPRPLLAVAVGFDRRAMVRPRRMLLERGHHRASPNRFGWVALGEVRRPGRQPSAPLYRRTGTHAAWACASITACPGCWAAWRCAWRFISWATDVGFADRHGHRKRWARR